MRTVSIAPNPAKRTKDNASHRRSPASHRRVAHVEGLVEALHALRDDRDICESAEQALKEITWARHQFERELLENEISRNELLDAFGDLDRLERRVQDILADRAHRLNTNIIPEVERCYHRSEYAI